MKLDLEFNNLAKSPIKKTFVEKVMADTLKEVLGDKLKKKKISLSLAVVSETEIKKQNKTYRRKDSPTDILTFCEYENSRDLEKFLAVEKEIWLGEALLCYNDIKKYCRQNKKNIKHELAEVISHGVLHMLGMDHGKRMFDIQKKVSDSKK